MIDIHVTYNSDKDIWCLLNKGKGSNNSQTATKVYEDLVNSCGKNPDQEQASLFIKNYIAKKQINIQGLANSFEQDWLFVAEEYHKRAENIFGVSLVQDVTVYLTVNSRCPYDIENNYFFISMLNASPRRTIMHELWHFYTWQKFGSEFLVKLGKQKYNDIKESLTILLNSECADLLPAGVKDTGYPQHQELRDKILELWDNTRNIEKVWASCE